MYPRKSEGAPRRPRRDRHDARDRRPPHGDTGFDRERSELEFTAEMHGRLQQFLASDEQGIALEPMNSFKRRVVHNLAKEYAIETESRGEDRDRHVYLIRTTSSATPGNAPRRTPGSAEAGPPEVEPPYPDDGGDAPPPPPPRVASPRPREERPQREERSGPRDDRPRRSAAPSRAAEDATDFASSSREWDFGSQTFPANPGEHGIHIAVKRDGGIELFQERDRNHIVADRVVTSKQFRVRKNRILQPGEPGW